MIILGIETSCDETAAAILEQKNGRIQILSNIVASSAAIQAKYGGIIPEQAAREQVRCIIPVIDAAISNSKCQISNIDAIAVTQGPGLIGSLLVGVETAKVLAKIWNKPLIPINHLLGHFYANWIDNTPSFPCLGLLVSGGHTDLVLFQSHGKYKYLGGTRDDAAGECFDKCARLLGLPYPGGPQISKLATNGNPKAFNLPRPMIDSKDYDFSFSGLKTAVSNLQMVRGDREEGSHRLPATPVRIDDGIRSGQDPEPLKDLAASVEQAIIDVLVFKLIKAVKKYKIKQIIIAGGVAANQKLGDLIALTVRENFQAHVTTFIPKPILCTDNAAMVASAAFFVGKGESPEKLQANPNLSLAY